MSDGKDMITHLLAAITHNSIFQVKQRTTRKVSFLFFNSFLLISTKLSFWQGDWTLGCDSKKFRHFPDIS